MKVDSNKPLTSAQAAEVMGLNKRQILAASKKYPLNRKYSLLEWKIVFETDKLI